MFGTEQAKNLVSNETEVILDEYRTKIKEALQKEKDRFREFSRQEATSFYLCQMELSSFPSRLDTPLLLK